jgi:isocitrate/isopropylmalate dehydrogenase
VTAIEVVLAKGPRTADLGGSASTTELGDAVTKQLLGA